MIDPSTCRVALLSGGTSGEREVSLASAEGARSALEEAGFSVTSLDPAKKSDLKILVDQDFDVAFLCLHGKGGEDGTIQGFLETIGIPYIGPGVCASALAMNKAKSKIMYRSAGVNTAPSLTLQRNEEVDEKKIVAEIGSHCVVKAATEGSSIGVYMVEGEKELSQRIEDAFEMDSTVVVERYVNGREFTVAVIGKDEVQALPVIEIIAQNDFYDFESKYAAGGSKHVCPAAIDEKIARRMQDQAILAHRSLGCVGVSRTDFIVDEEGETWALETNTIPGMTQTSLLPDAARAAGISFPELCTRLIEYAL